MGEQNSGNQDFDSSKYHPVDYWVPYAEDMMRNNPKMELETVISITMSAIQNSFYEENHIHMPQEWVKKYKIVLEQRLSE